MCVYVQVYLYVVVVVVFSIRFVAAPEVIIVDEHENPLIDKYYEVDSTIEMVCVVRYASMATSAVYWLHGQRVLNFDMTRGGVR